MKKQQIALVVVMAMMNVCAVGMEPDKTLISSKEIVINCFGGMVASTVETGLAQPVVFWKNMSQLGCAFSLNPRVMYRGCPINTACTAPVTAVQFGAEKVLHILFPGTTATTTTVRSLCAGAFSALVSTPIELTVLQQQKSGDTAYNVLRTIVRQQGASGLYRGLTAKAARESLFCVGLLSMYPLGEKAIRTEFVDSASVATIGAGIAAGIVTTIVSHPFDTLSTLMQSDYNKSSASTLMKTAQELYKKDGVRGFFRGVRPRGLRIMLAIPLMNHVRDLVSNRLLALETGNEQE